MKTILEKYIEYLEEGKNIFDHVRVTIKEDEQYGRAIVELKNGTPSDSWYDKEKGIWL